MLAAEVGGAKPKVRRGCVMQYPADDITAVGPGTGWGINNAYAAGRQPWLCAHIENPPAMPVDCYYSRMNRWIDNDFDAGCSLLKMIRTG